MAQFSGAVKLGDLNDFIAPSQACVVNLKGAKLADLASDVGTREEGVQLQPRPQVGGFSQTLRTASPTDPIKVSLHDCLACSGCVTSAETVLLEHQSVDELLSKLGNPGVTVVVSVSPQSRASLGLYHGLNTTQVFARLTGFLKALGVAHVFDSNAGREVALMESAAEFVHRYRLSERGATHLASSGLHKGDAMDIDLPAAAHMHGHMGGAKSDLLPQTNEHIVHVAPGATHSNGHMDHMAPGIIPHGNGAVQLPLGHPPDLATSEGGPIPAGNNLTGGAVKEDCRLSHGAHGMAGGQASHGLPEEDVAAGPLPMLASACPGWVCYAEKTHGDYVLPYISTAKSPQAVMGTAVKQWLASQWGIKPQHIYHCAVMPCYDKKLEASRDDFNVPGTSVPEVDCVLTTGEVQQLLESHVADLAKLPDGHMDTLLTSLGPDGRLHGNRGGAGGYLEHIFRRAAQELYGVDVPPGPLPLRTIRNADFQEVELCVEGRPVLRFAAAYGFRNIQTLVRKIKRGVCEYDYVEIMACPSACLNGGGQLKLRKTEGISAAAAIKEIEAVYLDEAEGFSETGDGRTAQGFYLDWLHDKPYGPHARSAFHTLYHKREKTVAASLGDW